MRKIGLGCWLMGVMLAVSSCDLLDCTQAEVSLLRIEACDINGKKVTLPDTLTITTCGTDSVLLNRGTNMREILLPLSYHYDVDTFVMRCYGKDYSVEDTLFVEKTNNIYFESPDCPTVMMHKINGVRCTDNFVSVVELLEQKVDFTEVTHLQLMVKPYLIPATN
jgi:hypothetical protein